VASLRIHLRRPGNRTGDRRLEEGGDQVGRRRVETDLAWQRQVACG
jgi:hypothetical protein